MGLGYGVCQPILYDKTSYFAPNDAKSTEYFSFLLTCNYIGIFSVPFIIEFLGTYIRDSKSPDFPFIVNGVIVSILAIIIIVKHKSFVVQAGVIPEGAGIVEQPSSVIAPGDRLEDSTDPEDNKAVPKDAPEETTTNPVVEMGRKEAMVLKAEAEQLNAKADELHRMAQELIDEANEVEIADTGEEEKKEKPEKPEGETDKDS